MKRILIVWIIVAVILVGALTFYGFHLKNTNGKYYELEKNLVNAAQGYYGQYPSYLPAKETSISSSKLISENFLTESNFAKDVKCTGYVIITKQGVAYKYKAYLKCDNYITKKYDAKYEE